MSTTYSSFEGNSSVDFATLDLLPYGIIIVNKQGDILFYNSREEQIACRRREDVVGKNFFTEVAPCTQVQEFYGRFKETMQGSECRNVFAFVFPFLGSPRGVEIDLSSFENKGELLCLITIRDVSEENALRERILLSERMREVGEVAAGVAHNFSNILNVIRGNAELMLMRMAEDDTLRDRAERIMKASNDGTEMVRRIGESARQQPEPSATATAVDLNEIVTEAAAWMDGYVEQAQAKRGAHIMIEMELSPGIPPVRASASELREVFVNLLRNAVDATEGQGRITVRSRPERDSNVVEVIDTGGGMSVDVLGKLFRPLFTTKGKDGTGLGLATCYAIMRRHGGHIEVSSTEGVGTTFTVGLPTSST